MNDIDLLNIPFDRDDIVSYGIKLFDILFDSDATENCDETTEYCLDKKKMEIIRRKLFISFLYFLRFIINLRMLYTKIEQLPIF